MWPSRTSKRHDFPRLLPTTNRSQCSPVIGFQSLTAVQDQPIPRHLFVANTRDVVQGWPTRAAHSFVMHDDLDRATGAVAERFYGNKCVAHGTQATLIGTFESQVRGFDDQVLILVQINEPLDLVERSLLLRLGTAVATNSFPSECLSRSIPLARRYSWMNAAISARESSDDAAADGWSDGPTVEKLAFRGETHAKFHSDLRLQKS